MSFLHKFKGGHALKRLETMDYRAIRHTVLISNFYSSVDQLFLCNVIPAESTHTQAGFILLSSFVSFVWGSSFFKCACGTSCCQWTLVAVRVENILYTQKISHISAFCENL